jgi:hypothetical protein
MSLAAERYLHEDAPDPVLLRRMASVCVASAASREMLKSPPKFVGSHYFMAAVNIFYADMDVFEGQPAAEPLERWDRLAGRVGRVREKKDGIKLRQWSLKVYDVHALKHRGTTWLNAQTLYRFEWDDQRTLMAERRMRLMDTQGRHVDDLGDTIDRFSVPEDMAAIWHAETEIARVTVPECEDIIDRMTGFFGRLR